MKKAILLLCLTLVSCFTEPKKIDTEDNGAEQLIKKDTVIEEKNLTPLVENSNSESQDSIDSGISLNILERLLNSDKAYFTEWCYKEGYSFDEIKSYDYFDVYWYKIENKNFISFSVPKDPLSKKSVLFETIDEKEFDKLYLECNKSDYKFIKNKESFENKFYEIYTNDKYELTFIKSDNNRKMKYSVALQLL